ncbi:striated muscle preferentially expressed protein kinase isoform X2 [Pyxicephalus adspersus]|uniref:striated muscle preferentially expressed protein kinase isoform X2 n=1 Tax=Pyxicephalus adspersus TaxID=30357 RepID=UPI003B5937E1
MQRAQVMKNLSANGNGSPSPQTRSFTKNFGTPPSPSLPLKHQKVTPEHDQLQPCPPQFLRKLKNAAIGTGCDIRLKVAVSGNPVPTLNWYKNKKPLDPRAEEYGTLCIRDSKMEDAGVYTCVAQNAMGEAVTSAVLAIIDLEEIRTFPEGLRTLYSCEVFRSCRKHSYDSEPGEEDTGGPQLQRTIRAPNNTPLGTPSGDSDTLLASSLHTTPSTLTGLSQTDEFSDWSGSQQTVVERDSKNASFLPEGGLRRGSINGAIQDSPRPLQSPRTPILPPPSPRLSQRPSANPISSSRGQSTPLTPRKKTQMPSQYQDAVAEEFEEKVKRPKSSAGSQVSGQESRPQTPVSESSGRVSILRASPKLVRSGSKIFDKLRCLEERRKSLDQTDSPFPVQSWLPLRKTRSFDQPGADGLGAGLESSTEELRDDLRDGVRSEIGGYTLRCPSLRYKTSSLDDRGAFSGRISDIEARFSQELSRIKRTVSQQQLIRSSQDLTRKSQSSLSSQPDLDSASTQVLKDSKPPEIQEQKPATMVTAQKPLVRSYATANQISQEKEPRGVISQTNLVPEKSSNGSVIHHEVVKQTETRLMSQAPPKVNIIAPKPVMGHAQMPKQDVTDSRHRRVPDRGSEPPPPSTHAPPALEIAHRGIGREKGTLSAATRGETRYLPWAVPPEPTKRSQAPQGKGGGQTKKHSDSHTSGKSSKTSKSKGKSRRHRVMSPELESSDDSYVSAEEDPREPPVFEIPLQSALVNAGSEVLLKCVISANPAAEVLWRKDRILLKNGVTHQIRADGERHSLLLRWALPSDSGIYTVTARNEVGEASSCGALTVKPAPVIDSPAHRGTPKDVLSPITSDDEYLSPQEDLSEPATPQRIMPGKATMVTFKAPPSFKVALSDQMVFEGQEVILRVHVEGEPKPMISWLKNKQQLKSGAKCHMIEEDGGIFALHISGADKRDVGFYTCKAINEYGTKQCEAKVEVRASSGSTSLEVLTPLQDVSVCAGEAAVFECVVSGPPDLDVDWMFRGKLLQPALLDCKMRFNGKQCLLLLNSVHEDDSGVYTCKLSTARDELTCSAVLTVHPSLAPLFTRKMQDRDVVEGRTARLDCKISGTPPPIITWTHFGQQVEESETVHILKERGHHTLLITHASSEDEGQYTVTARNQHGEAECSAELYVEEPRLSTSSHISKLEKMPSIPEEPEVQDSEVEGVLMPDFLRPLQDLDVVESREVQLECQVTGLPYPTITWYHNGKKIESTDDRRMTQFKDTHRLLFPSVSHTHAGVYKSVISNKVGKAACYAHLYVTDVVPTPPDGAPIITSVTGKTVKIRWNPPKRLDPAIDLNQLTYSIQQQVLGSPQWTAIASNVKETNYTVKALIKGHQYLFRVVTNTATAHSKPSPPSDSVKLLDRGPYLEEAPVIIDRPELLYMVENQLLCVTVTLNHVEANVTWMRAGTILRSVDGLCEMSMPDDGQHSLTFFSPKKSDLGPLTFEARNRYGGDRCTLNIEMAETPRFDSIMEDIEIRTGETARFVVVVEGKPIPDIMWYKNGQLLVESGHFNFVYDDAECSLVILNASPEDSGVYTCTARNVAGELSCKAELQVCAGEPGAGSALDESDGLKARRLTDYYIIHKEIGRGAFSYVRHVVEKRSGLDFAAKFISSRGSSREKARREMNMLSKISHERIVYFHEAFEKRSALIIIMELCSKEELLDRVVRKSIVHESEIRSFVRQILEGLDYLHHKKILHLDIKPENVLMADMTSDQIRICDFGNAQEMNDGEPQYCKYGTPEFVAPEIVNQMPISSVTDIWPVGVLAYLCLTGVSPFVGENDYTTLMNIRGYTVAFEEKMFADLTREARGFLIKVLGNEKLRPNAEESLEHPWFKTLAKGKNISTDHIKLFQSRRKWQRSLISFKSNMVMRSIPELLQDTSNHLSIAVPRNAKESSSLSSSSDSDDLEELPYVPMPLQVQFSGSRMSLNEIPTDEDQPSQNAEDTNMSDQGKDEDGRETTSKVIESEVPRREMPESLSKRPKGSLSRKKSNEAEEGSSSDEEPLDSRKADHPRKPLKKGSSLESSEIPDEELVTARRGELRRGSSADSALLLNVSSEDGDIRDHLEKGMTKAASMELPTRNRSPMRRKKLGSAEEEYAQRLELMRQRLLRGGSADNKLSGLRGPLMETLSVDKKRPQRTENTPPSPIPTIKLSRAASSEAAPGREASEEKVLRKTSSFSHSDTEPLILHRRSGAPLEIPLAQVEAQRLKESPSLSALTDQSRFDSRPQTPREIPSKSVTPEPSQQQVESVNTEIQNHRTDGKDKSPSLKPKADKQFQGENLEMLLPKAPSLVEDVIPRMETPSVQVGQPAKTPSEVDIPENNELVARTTETPKALTLVDKKAKQTAPLDLRTPKEPPKPEENPVLEKTQTKEITSGKKYPSAALHKNELSSSPNVSSSTLPSSPAATLPLPFPPATSQKSASVAPSTFPKTVTFSSFPPKQVIGLSPSSSEAVPSHLPNVTVGPSSLKAPATLRSPSPSSAVSSPGSKIVKQPSNTPVSVPLSTAVQSKETKQMPVKVPSPSVTAVREPPSVPKPQSESTALPTKSTYANMMQTLQMPTSEERPQESTERSKISSTEQPHPQEKPAENKPRLMPAVSRQQIDAKITKQEVAVPEPPAFSKVKQPSTGGSTENVNYISNIDSEEVFEAKFKRNRESSLTRGLKMLTRSRSEEKNLAAAQATREEEMYRPSPVGVPLEFLVPAALGLDDRSRSVQDLRDAERDPSFMRRLSQRFRKTPTTERKQRQAEEAESPSPGRRLSWTLGRGSTKDKKDTESLKSETGSIETISDGVSKEQKKASESPVLAMRRKFGNTMDRLSMKLRSQSEERRDSESQERKEDRPERRTPLMSLLRRSNSEGENLRKLGIPQNQLAAQVGSSESKESINSGLSIKSEMVEKDDRRSRWDRWGLSRSKRDKMVSQSSIPASLIQEDGSIVGRQYIRNESDFPPVFHIKLKDTVILEGDSVTLSCLPAGSPAPRILWKKDKMVLEMGDHVNIKSSPDGRQILTITYAGQREAGLYECVAANALGNATSSCSLSVARIPQAPGTPEIPQKYRNTVLVLWKSKELNSPCTYNLECQMNEEGVWKPISSGIKDCYYNVTELPAGSIRFRVACVNKAGQGPYSKVSKVVVIDGDDHKPSPAVAHAAQKARPMVPTISSFGPVAPRGTSPAASPPVVSSTKLPPSFGSPLTSPITSPSTNTPEPTAPTQPPSKGPPPPTPPRKHRGLVPTPPTLHRVLPQHATKVEPPSQVSIPNRLQSAEPLPAGPVTSRVPTVTVSVTPGTTPVSHLRIPPSAPAQQMKPVAELAAKTTPVTAVQRATSPTESQKAPSVPFVPPVKTVPILPATKSHVPAEPTKPLSTSSEPRVPPVKTVPVLPATKSLLPTEPTKPLSTSSEPQVPPMKTVPVLPATKSLLPTEPTKPLSTSSEPRIPPPVAPKPAVAAPSVPIMLHIPPFKSANSPLSPTSPTKPIFPSPPTSPLYKPPSPSSSTYMVTSFISMPPSTPTKETTQSQSTTRFTQVVAPTPATQAVAPTPIAQTAPFAPVAQTVPTRIIVKSVTPGKEGRFTPGGKVTPSGRESTTLRQGVPQKPYTFLEEKARGRFGVIRECKENVTGKHFMAKIIPYEQENKQSVLQEYEVLKCLHHQRILSLHEAYITPRYLVLISEQCSGREILYCLVERFRYSEDDVVNYLLQILQGLEYLHEQKILHLDIKPENIMVSYMNTIKIIDFGSAQTFNPLVPRQLGKRVGTLEYMAPEMLKGDPIGPAADIWGLGVLTYVMLSGRSPFFESDPMEMENKILSGRFDIFKLYSNASQSASLFIRKLLSIYPWSRPTLQECFSNPWLQDAYLMKLRRQTLTFTTNCLKEFLVEQQRRRSDMATKHKVLLRSYHGTQPSAPVTQ